MVKQNNVQRINGRNGSYKVRRMKILAFPLFKVKWYIKLLVDFRTRKNNTSNSFGELLRTFERFQVL